MEEHNKVLDRHVGHKIRERRKALRLTQAELADILGLSHQQVQRYESGENTVSMSRMLEIANSLNIKLNYFYDDAPVTRNIGQKIASGLINKDRDRPLRLLLVEDSSFDELLFRKATEQSGIATEIHVIQDSRNVIGFLSSHTAKCSAGHPDIVVLDINMPYLNGLELLKKIKGDSQLKTMPVIMLSNSVRSKDMLEAYANHANGFIQKNCDLQAFYEEINLALQYWSKTVVLPAAA